MRVRKKYYHAANRAPPGRARGVTAWVPPAKRWTAFAGAVAPVSPCCASASTRLFPGSNGLDAGVRPDERRPRLVPSVMLRQTIGPNR